MGLLNKYRYIISGTPTLTKPFMTDFPNVNEYLPVDIDLLEHTLRTNANTSYRHPVSELDGLAVSNFGREVQAAYLCNNVQEALGTSSPSVTMTGLKLLDSQLQEFFGSILCQSSVTWGLYCGSIAFSIGYGRLLCCRSHSDIPQRFV